MKGIPFPVADPGKGRPPFFLDQNETEGQKNFFEPPPLSRGMNDCPPPLSEGLDPPRFSVKKVK